MKQSYQARFYNLHRQSWASYFLLVGLWLVYAALAILPKHEITTAHYGVSHAGLNVILAILTIPALFVWFALLYAANRFYSYARTIRGSADGRGFNAISLGLYWLLGSSMFTSLLSQFGSIYQAIYGSSTTATNVVTIVSNYIGVISALGLFGFFLYGAYQLMHSINAKVDLDYHLRRLIIPVAVLGGIYIYAIMHNAYRQVSHNPVISPTYALPDWLIIVTVAGPYIVSWLMGFLAVAIVRSFSASTPGIVYRRMLRHFVSGMTAIVMIVVIEQYIGQISSSLLNTSLGGILAILSLLYFVIVVALVLVARGAAQLSKIEQLYIKE